jgi:hypothetical protein
MAVLRYCQRGQCACAIAVSWSPAQTHTRTVVHLGRTLHACTRKQVRRPRRLRRRSTPRMVPAAIIASVSARARAETACCLVCMHEHARARGPSMPPVRCACAPIAVRKLQTQPVPSDRGGPTGTTCPRQPSPCCAAFALGSTSGTACPASYIPPDTAGACKSAADAASRAYNIVAYSHYPHGCYWHTITGGVYYNSNAFGAANGFAQPLCAGEPTHERTKSTAIVARTLITSAGAAATAPSFSPAGGMIPPLRSSYALCGGSAGGVCASRSRALHAQEHRCGVSMRALIHARA